MKVLIVNKEFQMNRNRHRQRATNRLGFKSNCCTPQSPETDRGRGEQQKNWLQLRSRKREQYPELFRKNQPVIGENYG